MTDLAYIAVQALVSWLLVAVVASQIASMAFPLFRRLTIGGASGSRALALLTYGTLGPLVATVSVILIMNPQWAGVLVPEHCHGAECQPHRPAVGVSNPAGTALIAGSLAAMLLITTAIQRTILRTRRRLRALHLLADSAVDPDYCVIDSRSPMAWCDGLVWPRVYLSSGLVAELNAQELAAVLAHEHAHARRRDNLRQLLLYWLTLAWGKSARARLLGDFSSSSEQECDEAARCRTGDANVVIALLERLSRAPGTGASRQPVAFGRLDVRERIQALRAPGNLSLRGAWTFLVVVWFAELVALSGIMHRVIELLTLS